MKSELAQDAMTDNIAMNRCLREQGYTNHTAAAGDNPSSQSASRLSAATLQAPALDLPAAFRALADWIDIHEAAALVCAVDVQCKTQRLSVHMDRGADFGALFDVPFRVDPFSVECSEVIYRATVTLPFADFWKVME